MIAITIIIGLLLLLLFGFASASIAKSKNRDQMFWFFCGLLFGIIGLIVVALLPKLGKTPSVSRAGLEIRMNAYAPHPYIAMAIFAIVLTLIYDLVTNLAVAYTLGNFIPVMVAGIPFSLIHIASNLAIFVVLTPVLFKLAKMENR